MGWFSAAGMAYWSLFCVVFLAVALWETGQPWRKLSRSAERRWALHAVLYSIGLAATVAVLRVSAVATAAASQGSPYGLLNRDWLPPAARWIAAILALDLVRYWQHRGFHGISWLWPVHEVHHSDPDFDVTTAVRFHPLEMIVLQLGYIAAVALLAPPPAAVLTAELLGVTVNLWAHANASLPPRVERAVRAILVTPDLHRIHHSEDIGDQQSNLAQTFTFWDRAFGTFRGTAAAGTDRLVTGLSGPDNDRLHVVALLSAPFRRRASGDSRV